MLKRRPDGIIFDYIGYPPSSGRESVASKVQDLWIYGDAAQQALYARALNAKGKDLIERFVKSGSITTSDIQEVDKLYPSETSPLWQGRNPLPNEMQSTLAQRQFLLQQELWRLSATHAVQGVLDFLNFAILPVQQQGVKVGAVFFPEGNQSVGADGYDSRLQAWDRFPNSIEWNPIAYGACNNTSCIQDQVSQVLKQAPTGTQIAPAITGVWGQPRNNHPSLEDQMDAIQQVAPGINSVSHFGFSWQDPKFESDRISCRRSSS
ncbi:MAG: hypothetical protein NVS2B14_13820 [Chamaesiphon sp.]